MIFLMGSLQSSSVYVILYQPEKAPPEVFGPYSTPGQAANAIYRLSGAAGAPMDVSHSALLATIEINISGESHRYQLLKIASTVQLDIHAEVIAAERTEGTVEVAKHVPEPVPTRLSGY